MQINFDNKTNEIIKILALEAERFGVKIYFIGGLVRDILMGKKPLDIDILVEGDAIQFVQFLGDFVQIKSLHKDFGTIKTQISGIDIDFASTRKEKYPISGCLPVVEKIGCKLEEDLIRRDFTINAIAVRILRTLEYKLIDLYNGCKDIKSGILRVLHKKSYIDDPTRILRGLDFQLRFNFNFCDEDKKIIKEYLKNPNREGLSKDRVVLTLKKLFSSNERALFSLEEFYKKKYYKILYDEFYIDVNKFKSSIALFNVEDFGKVCLSYIVEIRKEQAPTLKNRFEIYKYFSNFSDVDLCVYYLKTEDNNAIIYFKELKNVQVYLKGSDLLGMGFTQGKIIGFILDKITEVKLAKNSTVISFEDEVNFVKNTFKL